MSKYIDAEKLIAKIKELNLVTKTYEEQVAFNNALAMVVETIDSLRQEQPEVDLEKEIDEIWNPRFNLGWDEHSALSMNHEGFVHITRHFYNLGLNARKED